MAATCVGKAKNPYSQIIISISWTHSFWMFWPLIWLKIQFGTTLSLMRSFVTVPPMVLIRLISAPYGVRAGAKRLGSKKKMSEPIVRNDGSQAHTYLSRYSSTDCCQASWFHLSHSSLWALRCSKRLDGICGVAPTVRGPLGVLAPANSRYKPPATHSSPCKPNANF